MEENPPEQNSQPVEQGPAETKNPEIYGYKIPILRTYEHDIEEAIAQKKISSASISIAEADARRKEPVPAKSTKPPVVPPPQLPIPPSTAIPAPIPIHMLPPTASVEPPVTGHEITAHEVVAPQIVPPRAATTKSHSGAVSGILKFIISIVLIAGGIYGGYYLYTLSPFGKESLAPQPAPVVEKTAIPSIIAPDNQTTVDVTNMSASQIFSAIQQSKMPGMTQLVFEETDSGLTTQVTASQFIAKIGMQPPDTFASSLNDAWMLGTDNGAPFMIFTTNFFQNTFAGMLAWEPTLPENLGPLFGFATGIQGRYEDRILDNKNIREFVGTDGVPVFLYGFTDNATLVITRNESTFSDIVGRIEKQTYVR